MDIKDKKILKLMEEDAEISLREIGKKIAIFSASSISKRIKSLRKEGYIEKVSAEINYSRLGYNFFAIALIKGKYSTEYHDNIASKLVTIAGVTSVYYVLGDIDFVVHFLCKDKDQYLKSMEEIMAIEGIDRSDSRVVMKVYKDRDYGNIEI